MPTSTSSPLAHGRQLAALVPGAELHVRPGESHLGSLAAAGEVLDVLLSYWPDPRVRREHSDRPRQGSASA